jgi:hypothetical protein
VVHSKANRSEQAVTRELSEVLSIFIVFVAKTIDSAVGTEKDDKNSKKAKKWKKKSTKKESTGKTKESAEKTKEPAGKGIMIRLYPNKSQK